VNYELSICPPPPATSRTLKEPKASTRSVDKADSQVAELTEEEDEEEDDEEEGL